MSRSATNKTKLIGLLCIVAGAFVTSASGELHAEETPCPAGSFINEAGQCVLCPKGTINFIPNYTTCFPCGKGHTTISEGSQTYDDCNMCAAGYGTVEGVFLNVTVCLQCDEGTFSTTDTTEPCQLCSTKCGDAPPCHITLCNATTGECLGTKKLNDASPCRTIYGTKGQCIEGICRKPNCKPIPCKPVRSEYAYYPGCGWDLDDNCGGLIDCRKNCNRGYYCDVEQPGKLGGCVERVVIPDGPLNCGDVLDDNVFPTTKDQVTALMRFAWMHVCDLDDPRCCALDPYDRVNVFGGDVSKCKPFNLRSAYREDTRKMINLVRKLAGLPGVTFSNPDKARQAAAAAVYMAANRGLTHTPSKYYDCYSADAYKGAQSSNLGNGLGVKAVWGYMADWGESNRPVLHRRWLLMPFVTDMNTGEVVRSEAHGINGYDYSALHVVPSIGEMRIPTTGPAAARRYTAWPPPGYIPIYLIIDRWHFTTEGWSLDLYDTAVLGRASVSVKCKGTTYKHGTGLRVVHHDAQSLVWELNLDKIKKSCQVASLKKDLVYKVTISGIDPKFGKTSVSYDVIFYVIPRNATSPTAVAQMDTVSVKDDVDTSPTFKVHLGAQTVNSYQQFELGPAQNITEFLLNQGSTITLAPP